MGTKVLMVGAGAVGQVYALHLQRGGADITFFVKPAHPLSFDLPLFPQVTGRAVISKVKRITSLEEVAARPWDQVWLSVPADALEQPWLPQLMKAAPDATVVAFSTESQNHVPPERLVLATIPFIAWQAPLPGAQGPSGIAFWMPPCVRIPMSGLEARAAPVRALLTAGGLPGKRMKDVAKAEAPMTALLIAFIAALEASGWSFSAFRKSPWPQAAGNAAREALALVDAPGPALWLARGGFFRLIVRLGTWLLPFDFETYLRFHFTKVGAQTRLHFHRWIQTGRERKIATPALEALLKQLPQL